MSLLRSTAIVGTFTLLSRVTGFVRDACMLAILGASPLLDAFIIAFKFPNFFRRISAEGAFSAAFVPLYAGLSATQSPQVAQNFSRQAFSIMGLLLLGFVMAFELFTPQLMTLFAPGFQDTPDRLTMAISFTRITFPYILLISLSSLMGGVLNTMGRFAAWSGAPLLLNLLMIASLLWLAPFVDNHGTALSWGVLAAGFAQFLLLWVVLARADRPLYPSRPQLTVPVKTLFAKMLPGIIGAGVFQINVFVDIWIGSFLAVGSLTYLHAADRLNQLPLSVIGIAISTAFLPTLSKLFQTQEHEKAQIHFTQALSYAMILTIPAACALFILAHPIAKVLFERGAFGPSDTLATAQTLQAFVLGLPAYVLAKVLSTGFFARQNTLTPVRIGCLCVGVNFALNLIFMFHTSLGYIGIALATALSSWVNVIFLSWRLNRDHIKVLTGPLGRTMGQIAFASGLMLLVLIFSKKALFPVLKQQSGALPWLCLLGLVSLGLVSYFICAHVMGLINLRQFYERLKGR